MTTLTRKKRQGGRREGAGRPPKYKELAKLSITLDAALLERLDTRREQLQLTRSAATQEAIRAWLGKRLPRGER